MRNFLLILIFISAVFSSCRKTYECRCKEEFEGVEGYYEFSFLTRLSKEDSKNVCIANNRDFEGRKVNCELIE